MMIQEFTETIVQMMQEKLTEDIKVSIQEITKNNGVVFRGLTFCDSKVNISPTIYLEDFYKEYREGRTFEDILSEMETIYEKSRMQSSIQMDFFTEYEKAKSNIVYKLIHYEKNKELLADIPHRPFLDLAIVYYYLVDMKGLSNATILIHNNHLELWKANEEMLFAQARVNSPRLLSADFLGMEEMLRELTDASSENREEWGRDDTGMYVLSNSRRMYGASALLYDGVKDMCARAMDGNYFILPSSVHEVILVPDDGIMNKEKLEEMVRDVNATQLEPQEILSDSVYFYSVEKGKVTRL